MLSLDKLDEVSSGLEHSPLKLFNAVHRRRAFKISSFEFAAFPKRTISP